MGNLSKISCCKCGNSLPDLIIFPCGHFVCQKCEGISSCLLCNRAVGFLKDSLSLRFYRKMVSEGLLLPRGKKPAKRTSFKMLSEKSTGSKLVDSSKLTKENDMSKLKCYDPNVTPRSAWASTPTRSTRASTRLSGQRLLLTENLLKTPTPECCKSPTVPSFSSKEKEMPNVSSSRATNRDRVATKIEVEDSLQMAEDVETPRGSKKSMGKTQKTRLSTSKKLDFVSEGVPDSNEIVPCKPPPSKRRKIFALPSIAASRLSLRSTKRHIDSSDEDDNIFIDSASQGKSKTKTIEVVAQVHANPCFSSASTLDGSQKEPRMDVGGNNSLNLSGDSPISDDFVGFIRSSQESTDGQKRGGSVGNVRDESSNYDSLSSYPLISSTSNVSPGIGPENALPSTEFRISTILSSPDDSYIKSSMTPIDSAAQILNLPKLLRVRKKKTGAKLFGERDHEGLAKNIPTVSKLDMDPCTNRRASVCLVDINFMQSSNQLKSPESSSKNRKCTQGTMISGTAAGDNNNQLLTLKDAKSDPNRFPENEPLAVPQAATNVKPAANPHIIISDVSTITETSTATISARCETDRETHAVSTIKGGLISDRQSITLVNFKQPSKHLDKLNIGGESLICRCDIRAECGCKQLTASEENCVSNSDRGQEVAESNCTMVPPAKVTNDAADPGVILIKNNCVDDEHLLSSGEGRAFDPICVQKSEKVDNCESTRNSKDSTLPLTNVAQLEKGTNRELKSSGEFDENRERVEPTSALSREDDAVSLYNQETEPMELSTENSVPTFNEDPLHNNSPTDVGVAVLPAKPSVVKPSSESLHLPHCLKLSTVDKSNDLREQVSPNVCSSSRLKVLRYHQELLESRWPTVHDVFLKLFAKIYSEEKPKSLSRLAVDVLLRPLKEEQIFQRLTNVSPLTESAEKSAQLNIFLDQTTVKVDVGQDPTKRNSFTRRQLSFAGNTSAPPRGENVEPEIESEDIVECTPTKLNAVRVNLLNDSVCSPLSRTIGSEDSFSVSRCQESHGESIPSTHRSQSSKEGVVQVATAISSDLIENRTTHSGTVTCSSSKIAGFSAHSKTVSCSENIPSEPAQWPHCFDTFQDGLPSSTPNCQHLTSTLAHSDDDSTVSNAGKQNKECTPSKWNKVRENKQTLNDSMCSPFSRTIAHEESLQEELDQVKTPKSPVENCTPHSRTVTCSLPKRNETTNVSEHQSTAFDVENVPTVPPERPNHSDTFNGNLLGSTPNGQLGTTLVHNDSESIIGDSEQLQQQKKKARLALPLDANNLPWPSKDIQERHTSPRLFRNITNILEVTTSGIYDRQQIIAVHKLCSLMKATYTKDVTQETTHLIIPSADNVNVTSKFLMALYTGSYILPFSWVRDCLESESVLPEVKYIPSYPGIQKRMSLPRGATLFDNYAFYLGPEIRVEDEVNYNALRKLMEFCGCKIVDSFRDLIRAASQYNAVILRHANYDNSIKPQGGIVQVNYQWFYACLTCYQIQPMDKPACMQ